MVPAEYREQENDVLQENRKSPILIVLSWGDISRLYEEMEQNGANLKLSVVNAQGISFFIRSTHEESTDIAQGDLKVSEGRGLS